MLDGKKVGDVMVRVDDYPHVGPDATVRDAMFEIKKASDNSGGKFRFRSVLVLDGSGSLAGVLSIRDLLRAVEPEFMKSQPKVFEGYSAGTDAGLVEMTGGLFSGRCREEAKKMVKDVIVPVKTTVGAEDSLAKAVYLMVERDIAMLPVVSDKKVVGAVRLVDLFSEVRDIVLNDR